MNTAERISIDYLHHDKVVKYYRNIKPIVKKHGKYFILQGLTVKQLMNIPFSWIKEDDAIFEEATIFEFISFNDEDTTILSLFYFEGKIAPTYTEVISQIPKDIIDYIVAFEVIKDSQISDDYKNHIKELNAGFHICKVRLYTKHCHNVMSFSSYIK